MKKQLKSLQSAFNISGTLENYHLIESDAGDQMIQCKFTISDSNTRCYIFQKLNQRHITDPESSLFNTGRITRHINWKLIRRKASLEVKCLTQLHAKHGHFHLQDSEKNIWQCFDARTHANPFQQRHNVSETYQIAKTFGEHLENLSDIHPDTMLNPVEQRGNAQHQVMKMITAVEHDSHGRVSQAKDEILYLFQFKEFCNLINTLKLKGTLPTRIIHCNASPENLIQQDKNEGCIGVTGLCYTMPGLALYDFGTIVCHTITGVKITAISPESGIHLDLGHFKEAVKGFTDGCPSLNPAEINYLAFGPKIVAIDLATRYLNDFLQGDQLYTITHPEDNLRRCRSIIKLIQLLDKAQNSLTSILNEVIKAPSPMPYNNHASCMQK